MFGNENEAASAEWSWKNGKPAGRGTDTLREAKGIYFPLETPRQKRALLFLFGYEKERNGQTDILSAEKFVEAGALQRSGGQISLESVKSRLWVSIFFRERRPKTQRCRLCRKALQNI